nr:hypothetical protein [Candidatus Woesearchaeota archaeon]
MKKKLVFTLIGPKESKNVTLEEITAEEKEGKKYIGTAIGKDVSHCAYLAAKYEKTFLKEGKYYYINTEKDKDIEELRKKQPNSIKVEFYGELNDKRRIK